MNSLSISSADVQHKNRNTFKQSVYNNMSKPAVNNIPPAPQAQSNGMSKTLPIVSSAVALASLGVATYAIVKKPGGVKNIERQLETISKDLAESKTSQGTVEETIKGLTETVNSVKTNTEKNLGEIRGELSQNIGNVRGEIDGVRNTVKAPQVVNNMLTRDVEVNGEHFQLAQVMHGYGKEEKKLTEQLRAESTRRILGAVKPIKLPDNAMVRVPTAEFQGITKTGGLAVVPRELIANLGALVNNKQKMELVVDTPMYLGQVENTNFFSVVKKADGKFDYVSKKNGKESLLTRMTKIDENFVPIYTDTGKTTERLELFLSDEMRQPVPYEDVLPQFEPEMAKQIAESMEKGQNLDTQLVYFIAPQPAKAAMKMGNKSASLNYDRVLESLDEKTSKEIKDSLEIGKDYELSLDKLLEKKGGNKEEVVKLFDEESAEAVSKALEDGEKAKGMKITFTPPTEAEAEVKFKAAFYKNDKFRMDGPVQEGLIKNIYNNQTTQAGETERNVYFCKYMYENLVNNHESADKPLRADWIIGNDWHTGALSAMTRLLTPARKAMGMEPEAADKLYNTPITTIMHNFKLQGAVWHSQPKLLNVMFGEHAAKITENAWMPQKADLPGNLMNGLFSEKALNPQTMAMAYSDDIIFVSRGNFNEMSTVGEYGGTNYALASMRGRTWQYAKREKLEEIAMASGIRPDEIGEYATAKGVTNGSDRVNNIITKRKARKLERVLNLPVGSLISAEKAILDPHAAHQNNKAVYLKRVIEDLNTAKATGGKDNPLKIRDFEHTDLTGVNENTLVTGMAGRVVDQKGFDNWAEAILIRAKRGNYDKENPPMDYLQGIGDEAYIGRYMQVKNEVREIDPKLADRMMFAGVFSEEGRYDGAKMIFDFDGMPSWDEPCGLVHKEIASTSGAIPLVNKRGGLTDGLTSYQRGADNSRANAIFVDFMDKETHPYENALKYNSEKLADNLELAQEWYKDKPAFANGIKESYTARHDWIKGGKAQEYAEIGKRHGVICDKVDSNYTA